jgi:hypothetical protein
MSSYLQPRISSTTNVSELGYLSIWPKPSLTKIIPPPPPPKLTTTSHLTWSRPGHSPLSLSTSTLALVPPMDEGSNRDKTWGRGANLRCPVSTTVRFSLRNEGSSEYIHVWEGGESLSPNFKLLRTLGFKSTELIPQTIYGGYAPSWNRVVVQASQDIKAGVIVFLELE